MNYNEAVVLAREGKEEGYRFLYDETYSKSYYIALKYMKQEDAAQDVLQEAYIKAFSNLEQLTEADRFPGWFSRIVATKALDALKKKRPILFSEMETEDGIEAEEMFEEEREEYQPEISVDRAETSRLIKEMLEELTDEQRMCILMFYMEQMSVKEIAQTVGVSENTVKSRLNLGRQKIKEKVLLLEKKGTKLYGLGPVVFFLSLLHGEKGSVRLAYAAEQELFTQIVSRVAAGQSATVAMSGLGSGVLSSTAFKVITTIACISVITVGATVAVKQMNSTGNDVGPENVITEAPDMSEPTIEPEQPEITQPTIESEQQEGTQKSPSDFGEVGQDKVLYEDEAITVLVSGDTIYVRGTGMVPSLTQYIRPYMEENYPVPEIKCIIVEDGISGLGTSAFAAVSYIDEIILADSVTSIGEKAFYGTMFQVIQLPEHITEIGSRAFESCVCVKELVIPEGVTKLTMDTFTDCPVLEKVFIPGGCTMEGDYRELFEKCENLSYVIYGEGATEVKLDFGIENLDVEVQIPATATEISLTSVGRIYGEEGSYAHRYASEKGIEFWVGTLGDENAHRVEWLPEEIDWPVKPENQEEFFVEYSNGWSINGTLICIGSGRLECYSGHEDYLVEEDETLRNVFIEESITGIDAKYFRKLKNLEYVIMENGVMDIGEEAFYQCESLKGLQLSGNLQTLGARAFYGCTSLTQVILPSTLSEISESSFAGSGLKTVVFAEGLRVIGRYAFSYTKLREVNLPEGVECIEAGAFRECEALHRIYIPESVSYIADDAFDMCGDLVQGIYYTSNPEMYRFVICGKAGSYAETYATEHGYTFEVVE